jgi:hypothetical protein
MRRSLRGGCEVPRTCRLGAHFGRLGTIPVVAHVAVVATITDVRGVAILGLASGARGAVALSTTPTTLPLPRRRAFRRRPLR